MYGKGLCRRHWTQVRKKGEIQKRTTRDWNRIVMKEMHAEVILENRNCEEVARCLIDQKDVDKVEKYCWCWTGDYVQASPSVGEKLSLARYLMGAKQGEFVLHRDHDPLNNHRANLFTGDASIRLVHRPLRKDNKTGYKGVYYSKRTGRWSAGLKLNGKRYRKGGLKTLEEGIKARRQFEDKYLGGL